MSVEGREVSETELQIDLRFSMRESARLLAIVNALNAELVRVRTAHHRTTGVSDADAAMHGRNDAHYIINAAEHAFRERWERREGKPYPSATPPDHALRAALGKLSQKFPSAEILDKIDADDMSGCRLNTAIFSTKEIRELRALLAQPAAGTPTTGET